MTEITKEQIQAIKRSDRVHITWQRPLEGSAASAYLRCIRKADKPLTADLEYVFSVAAYAKLGNLWVSGDQERVDWVSVLLDTYRFDQTTPLTTALGLLRAGDDVSLEFYPSGGSEALERAGFVIDTVYLNVQRGKKRMAFEIHRFTVPRDSGIRTMRVSRI